MHDFVPLTVAEVRRETDDAVVVALAVPADHRQTFRHRPGQHLAIRARVADEEVRRTYSISSPPGAEPLAMETMRAYLKGAGLRTNAIPEQIVHTDVIPRNPSGKITKNVLRDRYASEPFTR